ncbi:hypothetical protein BCR39DRAFT_83261 [Naematelia encephala]|uniref:Uncharacterized protein n=1 Tax=Naematelia encephala TaxID=71784 RepID=A0A1Y2ADN6_9TREE|nr:hypothetical protein BCR39DRAFT_83261 [Naematelia encephala]
MRLSDLASNLAIAVLCSAMTASAASLRQFTWPLSVAQCEVVPVVLLGGTPPFKFYLTPLNGQNMAFELLPPDANSSDAAQYNLQMQFAAGTYYTAWMSDADGIGGGGVTTVSQVAPSNDSSCLGTAQFNLTQNMFAFNLTGALQPCTDPSTGDGMRIEWNGAQEDAPYNMTVIPCDQSYVPFEVPLNYTPSGLAAADWRVNMTSGSRFTVMMNNKFGRGRGGVANVYEVQNASSTTNCASQTRNTDAISWPSSLTAQTLPAATVFIDTGNESNSIGSGAVAGIAVGSALGVALAGLAIFYVFRKRKQSNEDLGQKVNRGGRVDMLDVEKDQDDTPRVDPFMYQGIPLVPTDHDHDHDRQLDSTANSDETPSSSTPFLSASAADLKAQTIELSSRHSTATPSARGYTDLLIPGSSSSGGPSSSPLSPSSKGVLSPSRGTEEQEPAFVRHTDGGSVHEVEGIEPSGGVVDLPPMYSDVPSRSKNEGGDEL